MADDTGLPWNRGALQFWAIVGMNHYWPPADSESGLRHLFVAMTCKGMCIKEEGPDESAVFERLEAKAVALEALRLG